MKKLILGTIAATVAGAAAWAGGLSDAIVETVPEVMEPMAPAGSGYGWIIPLVVVGALIAVAVAGGDDDDEKVEASG